MNERRRIVVLGTTGMLGSMVRLHLERNPAFSVRSVARAELDACAPLDAAALDLRAGDFVVNCIGVIKPFCRDDDAAGVERAIRVNALFPHALARAAAACGARVVQIATDCVYSGETGNYDESSAHDPLDVYGKTKSLGEPFRGPVLNVRCSIVGPERDGRRASLLEWFLSQPPGSTVNGFTHHRWNGVTTLQFARLCERIAAEEGAFERALAVARTQHFVPNEQLTKADMLELFADVFGHPVAVRRVDTPPPRIDRTLATRYGVLAELFPTESLRAALEALREVLPAFRTDASRPQPLQGAHA